MFRISGTLLVLILSLTFANLRNDHAALRDAIRLEAAEILDVYSDLGFFGGDEAEALKALLLQYTRRVIDVEWTALAGGQLDPEKVAASNDLQFGMHELDASTTARQSLRANLIQDVDEISDHRQHRAFQAVPDPPVFTYVGLVGFLLTMAVLGVYRLTGVKAAMISLYCFFIGLVLYFMLAMSFPFFGVMQLNPLPLERVYEQIQGSTPTVTE